MSLFKTPKVETPAPPASPVIDELKTTAPKIEGNTESSRRRTNRTGRAGLRIDLGPGAIRPGDKPGLNIPRI